MQEENCDCFKQARQSAGCDMVAVMCLFDEGVLERSLDGGIRW
jgi:hypothetical protein